MQTSTQVTPAFIACVAAVITSLVSCSSATDIPSSIGNDTGGAASNAGGATSNDNVSFHATLLASNQVSPIAIAVDHRSVYWYNFGTSQVLGPKTSSVPTDGQLVACAKGGCEQTPTVLASNRQQGGMGIPTPMGLATDGANVYWSDMTPTIDSSSGGLFKCSVDGCNDSPELISAVGGFALAVDGTSIFYTQFSATVYSCAVTGCGSTPTPLWSAGYSPCATGIAVDASGVYWATMSTEHIMRCDKAGCGNAPTMVMSGTGSTGATAIFNIAMDNENVYFSDQNGSNLGMVLKCAKTGCGDQPGVLASGLNGPTAIATDGVYVYWIESPTVRRCAVGGCNNAPTTIYTSSNSLAAIALDESNVYWIDRGPTTAQGQIWMASK